MTERDELAAIIDDRWHGYGYNPQGAAAAILAAGYRKPRTIATPEELDAVIPDEAIEAAADAIAQDDGGACECRRSSYDKHDINPPCSGRRRAARIARAALQAAAPYLMAEAWSEGRRVGRSDPYCLDPNPYREAITAKDEMEAGK